MRLAFTADPGDFLAQARGHLEQHPVLTTVPATYAERRVRRPGGPGGDEWYVVVLDRTGAPVGVGMRTSPGPGRAAYLGPMPEAAAALIGRTLHDRGERLDGVGGSLSPARTCAEETVRLTGGRVEVVRRTRLFELGTPVPPRAVPGRLRSVTTADLDLVTRWYAAFHADAEEQAGRARQDGPAPSAEDMQRRVGSGRTFVWEDASGTPVHLTGSNPPSFGVARIAPVYTPAEQRGRGYAAAAVHAVASGLLAEGARVVLFTDLANPTSNALYARLGFAPVVDTADFVMVGAGS